MNKSEVRKHIVDRLSKELKPAGFKWNAKEEGFLRSSESGLQAIFLPLYDYKPEFIFSFIFGIRIEKVEEVFNQFSGVLPEYQNFTMTSHTALDYFTGEEQSEYLIADEESLNAALEEFIESFMSQIFGFFEQYADPTELAIGIEGEYENIPFDNSNDLAHAMHTVILAKLYNPKYFEETILDYEKALSDFPQEDLSRFDKLVRFLRSENSIE